MGMLYLVRHGQAAFLTDNYDRLSDLGKRQGACLGSWWAEQGLALDSNSPLAVDIMVEDFITRFRAVSIDLPHNKLGPATYEIAALLPHPLKPSKKAPVLLTRLSEKTEARPMAWTISRRQRCVNGVTIK